MGNRNAWGAYAAFLVAVALTGPAAAGSRAQPAQQSHEVSHPVAQIPVCRVPLGTVSVTEPADAENWRRRHQLPPPSRLVGVLVARSRCFTLRDHGVGPGSQVADGAGQLPPAAADFVLEPDLAPGESRSGPADEPTPPAQAVEVVLTLVDQRGTGRVAVSGSASRDQLRAGASGTLFTAGGLRSAGVGGYASTEYGQVVAFAYLQAYTDLVVRLGGWSEDSAEAAAARALRVDRAVRALAGGTAASPDPGSSQEARSRPVGREGPVRGRRSSGGGVAH